MIIYMLTKYQVLKHLENDMDARHWDIVLKKVAERNEEIKAVFLIFLIPICARVLQCAPTGSCEYYR